MSIPKEWPTHEMIVAGLNSLAANRDFATGDFHLNYNTVSNSLKKALAAAPTPPAQSMGLPPDVLYALRFYANGEHFNIDGDAQEFDTVSGEPINWLFSERDDDCTMIENGGIAKLVLQGKKLLIEDDVSKPIEGEIFHAHPADDELRKAALALLRVLNEGGDRAKAMQELDAALKEQK